MLKLQDLNIIGGDRLANLTEPFEFTLEFIHTVIENFVSRFLRQNDSS